MPKPRISDITCIQCADEREKFIINAVIDELRRAQKKHPPMISPHHGHSVLLEEIQEAFEEIQKDNALKALEEMIQVAASAIRFVIDDPFSAEAKRREEWQAAHA